MLMLWFFTFQSSWGPLTWVLTAEVPPVGPVREKMVNLTGFAAYGKGPAVVFVNPYTQTAIGGSAAFIYGAFSVAATLFMWFLVPELKHAHWTKSTRCLRRGCRPGHLGSIGV